MCQYRTKNKNISPLSNVSNVTYRTHLGLGWQVQCWPHEVDIELIVFQTTTGDIDNSGGAASEPVVSSELCGDGVSSAAR